MTLERVNLVDGPSVHTLVDAYKYAYEGSGHDVKFTSEDGRIFIVQVNGLMHKDVTRHIFKGNLRRIQGGSLSISRRSYVKGHIDIYRRKGYMEISDRPLTF